MKNLFLRWLIVAALSLADRIPASLLDLFGRCLGWLGHRVLRREVAAAEARVERYLPRIDPKATVREAFINAGSSLAACLMLRRPSVRALDTVSVTEASADVLVSALACGKGVVFVSAHLGPFELIPAVVRELGFPVSIVVRESYDPDLDPHVDAHRIARGLEVIHRGRPGASTRILRALRRGRPVGILPDLGARTPSRWVPFLGGRALLPVGPARLAARLGAPLIVGTLYRSGRTGHFDLRMERVSGASEGALHAGMAVVLGERIAACPGQWLWMGAKSLTIADSPLGELDFLTVQSPG